MVAWKGKGRENMLGIYDCFITFADWLGLGLELGKQPEININKI